MNKELSDFYDDGLVLDCDVFGNSPLFYSIKADNQKCTDSLIGYLSKSRNEENFQRSMFALTSNFEQIILNSSDKLHLLMRRLLICSHDIRGHLKQKLPIYNWNMYSTFDIPTSVANKEEGLRMITYKMSSSAMPVFYKIYSLENTRMLETILACTNDEIFKTPLIQYIINAQWKILEKWILLYSFFVTLNVFLFILLVSYDIKNVAAIVSFIILNTLILVWQVLIIKASGRSYFRNIWNLCDFSRCIFIIIWLPLAFCDIHSTTLIWFVGLLILIRGITGFRYFEGTRYYVQLILHALNDAKYFLFVFAYSNFFFGVLFTIARKDPFNFQTIWVNPYGLNFGTTLEVTIPSIYTLEYIVYVACTLINVIMMLNLLISILGKAFGDFQARVDIIIFREKAELVLEVHRIFHYARIRSDLQYLHVVDHSMPLEKDDEVDDNIKPKDEGFNTRLAALEDKSENTLRLLRDMKIMIEELSRKK